MTVHNKYLLVLFFSLILSPTLFAQKKERIEIQGTIFDSEYKEGVERATIQLLALPDSVFVTGTTSEANGQFKLSNLAPANYVLKISYIGYKTLYHRINRNQLKEKTSVGRLNLVSDAILLSEAVVTAEAPQVTVVQDTVMFNTSAYRVSKNAMLEELIRKLPGAQVDEEGKITINGQEVSKILVDGKEFFAQDPDVAMKNLPVDIVDKVKSYNKKSDQARITGIDDGNDETVIDLSVKKGMNKGWFGNADLGIGNEDRYTAKGMLNRFWDGDQLSGVFNFNNVRDASVGSRRRWSRNNGMNERKSGGVNLSFTRPKFEIGGNVNISDNENEINSKTNSETFLQDASTFSRGLSSSINNNKQFNSDFRLEWKPDTLTNIMFFPWINYGQTRAHSKGESMSGDVDNFDSWQEMIDQNQAINSRLSEAHNSGKSLSFGTTATFHRRLSEKGRNIFVNMNYSYGSSDNSGTDYSEIEYFKMGKKDIRNLLTRSDNDNYSYRIKATYSEPIFKQQFLQIGYSYGHTYNKSNRRSYNLDGYVAGASLDDFLDPDLSKFARNYYDNQEISLNLNTIREKYRLNIGFALQPQRNKLEYEQGDHLVDTVRSVVNYTPTFDFRYQFDKQSFLRVMYRGNTRQPNMMDLLPIRDITNPLNIREGNPGLKPSYTNYLMAMYRGYYPKSQRSLSAHFFFQNTLNSVSSRVTYDAETGGKVSRPENINGNWNLRGFVNFTTPFKNKKFTLSSNSGVRYVNNVGYLSQDAEKEASKNKTRNLGLSERLDFNYRNDWFEAGITAAIDYSKVKNTLQPQVNRETFDYDFGLNTNIQLPWDLSISSDGSYAMKKGYSQGLDRNEFIWNAQISKDFLKQKQATISFQVFDILKQRSNLSRSITASMSQDIQYEEITNFFMVHFVYKLNTFGGGKGTEMNRGRGRRGGGRMHMMH